MTDAYGGQWARRGMIHHPIVDDGAEEPKILCAVCGSVSPAGLCRPCRDSARVRVHGSHAGFAQHQRRNELVCRDCSDAEKVYQDARYRPGQLAPIDLAWCEKNSVRHSWELACRRARVANNHPEEPPTADHHAKAAEVRGQLERTKP